MGTAEGAQRSRIVGGSQRIAERMAEELGDAVALGEPVRAIDQRPDRVVVTTAARTLDADAAIVTIPQHLIAGIAFDPPLPARRAQLVQNVPMGSVIKIIARYERPFWRDAGLAGFCVSLDHPVSVIFDKSPPDSSCGMLVGFFEGAHARTASGRTFDWRRQTFTSTLEHFFGPEAAHPDEVVELDWSSEPWSGGCYGGHFTTGVWTQFGEALRAPHGPPISAVTDCGPSQMPHYPESRWPRRCP
jgi:monoamine oxidase